MPETAVERIPDYSRLSRAEISSVLALHRAGKTQPEIAQAIGCDQSTVSRWLSTYEDTTQLATHTLKAKAINVAERLAETKHAPTMLELLRDLGVTEKKAPAGESKGGVNVYIGVKDSEVQVSTFACSTAIDSQVIHSLTEARESDK